MESDWLISVLHEASRPSSHWLGYRTASDPFEPLFVWLRHPIFWACINENKEIRERQKRYPYEQVITGFKNINIPEIEVVETVIASEFSLSWTFLLFYSFIIAKYAGNSVFVPPSSHTPSVNFIVWLSIWTLGPCIGLLLHRNVKSASRIVWVLLIAQLLCFWSDS